MDVYFLKAELREGGIKIGEEIRKRDEGAVIVFIAESEIYAYKAFSIYAYQYLLSPVRPGKIFEIMDRVLKPTIDKSERRFSVKTKESLLTIAYSDVVFIECRRHVLCFSLKDGSVVKSTHIRSSFEDATATILSDERFIHPHKSYIINMDCINSLAGQEFVLKDGKAVPIARKSYSSSKSKYLAYLDR
ncbi:MAG: LytTR family transcriptional regulator DNA-binding domain-containing protein [Oscillospiraceae bacterium]